MASVSGCSAIEREGLSQLRPEELMGWGSWRDWASTGFRVQAMVCGREGNANVASLVVSPDRCKFRAPLNSFSVLNPMSDSSFVQRLGHVTLEFIRVTNGRL